MDFQIYFLNVGDGDAIIIWIKRDNNPDFVIFVDGGCSGNGQKIVDHFNTFIHPYLPERHVLGFVNTHPHEDHIDGLLEVLQIMGNRFSFGIYNDPVECITEDHRDRIYKEYQIGSDDDISHLYKTFQQVEQLNHFIAKHGMKRYSGFSNENNFLNGNFKILSPAREFYVSLVQYFSDVDFLKKVSYARSPMPEIDPFDESLIPCNIIDEVNDTSPENLTSIVIQLIDNEGEKVILTSDAGVDSFDYMEYEGFDLSNLLLVQLPHHGSRRNISTAWIKKFNPTYFVASAAGNAKHPRRALINCIKRNLKKSCTVFSTHNNGDWITYVTNPTRFSFRNFGSPVPL